MVRGWTLEQALGVQDAPPRFRNFEGHARDHKWKEVRVTDGKTEPIPDTDGYKLYLVTNTINGKVYVGLTIGDPEAALRRRAPGHEVRVRQCPAQVWVRRVQDRLDYVVGQNLR
jgi:hypothetical protein